MIWDPIECTITECAKTMYRFWPDDGSLQLKLVAKTLILYVTDNISCGNNVTNCYIFCNTTKWLLLKRYNIGLRSV